MSAYSLHLDATKYTLTTTQSQPMRWQSHNFGVVLNEPCEGCCCGSLTLQNTANLVQ